jgi:hypothetical protein
MAVLKEFKCLAHGAFDAKEAICPRGCTTVIREFRTAPAGRSAKTKASDAALESLAKKYGLSDMSNRSGSVGGSRRAPMDFAPVWGAMPKGNVYEVGKGEVQREGAQGGASAALQSVALPIGGKQVALNMTSKDAGVSDLEKKLGAVPSFMGVSKSLPRVRPHPVGREPGSPQDLAQAIDKAP